MSGETGVVGSGLLSLSPAATRRRVLPKAASLLLRVKNKKEKHDKIEEGSNDMIEKEREIEGRT